MLELKNVGKVYPNGTIALKNISLKIYKGEFVYIVGPSGAGKTTIFKLLTCEEKATYGQIKIGSLQINQLQKQNIPILRRQIGVVFQNYLFLDDRTIYENLKFVLTAVACPPKKIAGKISAVLKLVDLEHKSQCYPKELSIGEQQRIVIARAIINRPMILIADEPTNNLDDKNSVEIMRLFYKINQLGTTIIMATHNSTLVNTIRHRVVEIKSGKIIRDQSLGGYGSKNDESDIFII